MVGTPTTPSLTDLPAGLSPEVAWFMTERGIPLPDCPPRFFTPSPGEVPGAVFDTTRVDRVLAAFARLRHTKGRQFAGKPLIPDPWQVGYAIAPVFGWVRWDEDVQDYVRIVNTLYVEVPRKNGKTTLCGGFGMYMTAADGEDGAEVYAVAAGKDQARKTFDPIKTIAQKSPDLSPYVKCLVDKIVHQASGSYFQVVSSVAELLHGSNPHCAVIDELHVHKSGDVLEAVDTGTGARTQPLIVIITTAGSAARDTAYDSKRRYIEQLCSRVIEDRSTYGVIWAADEHDDPFSEDTWRKANPGYGISPTRSFMERQSNKARNSPVDLASFFRLHLGIRIEESGKYLTLESWDRNSGMVREDSLRGRECLGGLDLAATGDFTALCWLFPDLTGGFDVLWRFWMPESGYEKLLKRTHGRAIEWRSNGWMVVTPGETADYRYIKAQIDADREKFRVRHIGFDPWNASQLTKELEEEGASMVMVRQGFASLSPPLKAVQQVLMSGTVDDPKLRSGGNPVARWMVDNLVVITDANGNVKPDRKSSRDKIDGVAALVMAMACELAESEKSSVITLEGALMA